MLGTWQLHRGLQDKRVLEDKGVVVKEGVGVGVGVSVRRLDLGVQS